MNAAPEAGPDSRSESPHDAETAQPPGLAFRDRRDFLEANLARQLEAIRGSDAKITLLTPTTTAMIGVLAALYRGERATELDALALALTAAPLLVAYFFMALSLIPRLRPGARTLLFFGGIATMPRDAFRAAALAIDQDAYLADLADQCHATAAIARTKYRHGRLAYLAFFLALPFWAFAVYLLSGSA